jgi:hypothetical protein
MQETEKLREKAKALFDACYNVKPGAYERYFEKYLSCLFTKELALIKKQAIKDSLDFGENNHRIMIITLGTSLEPLVLATHLVASGELFVLYTQQNHLEKFSDALSKTGFKNSFIPILIPEKEGAADVFKLLRGKPNSSNPVLIRNLRKLKKILDDKDKRNQIVFDITGAKKTISGGCLLFAAYYELPVYYMDFGDDPNNYDPDLGRPYPGACFYTRQENPIVGFCIKDFERLKENFDQRRFNEVDQILAKILEKMNSEEGKEFFKEDERKLYKELIELNRAYIDWQDGWYGDLAKSNTLESTPHSNYLQKLGGYPSRHLLNNRVPLDYQASLYDDIDGFASYVTLELANLLRASPLSKRNRFLRAYRLEEFLLGYMCLKLNNDGKIVRVILRKDNNGEMLQINDLGLDAGECVRVAVCRNYGSIEHVFKGLVNDFSTPVGSKRYVKFVKLKNPNIGQGIKNAVVFFNKNRWVRDASVHGVGTVPDELVDSRENTLSVFDHLETLWKELLKNRNTWFPNNSYLILDNIECLIKKDQWYFDATVAPFGWEMIEKLIELALGNGNAR